ncbi:MAG: flagellar export chaperone FliS [Eubacteriales bacterium]
MYQNQAYATNVYKSNQITTASGKKLLIMLYDGAIKNLKLAEKYIDEKNIEKININVVKTQAILAELISTLDFNAGGEIANNLNQLYGYMYTRLIQGNIEKDKEAVIEVRTFLQDLRETWMQI